VVFAITVVCLNASEVDVQLDTSVFHPPQVAGFEEFRLSPALNSEISQLNWTATAETAAQETVSSVDCRSGTPESLRMDSSIQERPWTGQAVVDSNVRVPPLKLALGGMLALLALVLVGLAVSFFTIREPIDAKPRIRPAA